MVGDNLRHNMYLRKINLESTSLKPAGVSYILNALATNRALLHIDLSRNKAGDGSGASFLAMLRVRNVRTLKLILI